MKKLLIVLLLLISSNIYSSPIIIFNIVKITEVDMKTKEVINSYNSTGVIVYSGSNICIKTDGYKIDLVKINIIKDTEEFTSIYCVNTTANTNCIIAQIFNSGDNSLSFRITCENSNSFFILDCYE